MLKLDIFRKSFLILSIVLIFMPSWNTLVLAADKDDLIFKNNLFLDSSFINQSTSDESATITLTNSSDSQSQGFNLRSAHRYLGFATAALAGITAVSFSSQDLHQIAGYTTAGLSLITSAIGFYEYGEYFDLNEGFTGYNMHMILETAATIGFMATAAMQSDKSTHAIIGGVSTAMMILPIFVIHW